MAASRRSKKKQRAQGGEPLDPAASDKEFEREFAQDQLELERTSRQMPWVMLAIFGGIALICLTIAVISGMSAARKSARALSASGRVVDVVARSSYNSETGNTDTIYFPVVQFAPQGLPVRTVQMNQGAYPPEYSVGDGVTVLYDPLRPNDARIKSFSGTLLLWILPGITGVLGAAFALATLLIWKFFMPEKDAAQPAA